MKNPLNRLIINLCPTGMLPTKEFCPNVPISAKEIALDVKRCYELGVSMVHLHARNSKEEPVWESSHYSEIIQNIKLYVPDMITVVTTSGRNWSELEYRSDSLSADPKPDMGSLTLGSLNFPKQASINPPDIIKRLLSLMTEKGIVPELEIFNTGMINFAHYLISKDLLKPPYYFNLILGSLGSASLNATNLAAMTSSLPLDSTWSIGGIGRYQLAANTMGIALGGHVRVGLEDNPYLDWTKKTDASNPRLLERIIKIAKEFGREVATPSEARDIIGL
ncbi:3-keto-5-aminohexanoate cleavage protein [Saprospiraceae bacterium]|nr:3-keto-5-aminohexanoate cleavage protein [Saprospiraceae bacterium]